jgi:periplasmic divalent cation tolerance protein
MPDEFVIVLSTVPAPSVATSLARTLVEERLAACVNILPAMTSIYRWRDGIEEEAEHQLVIKTARARIPALRQRLHELHPYEVPEFIVLAVAEGSEGYLRWVRDSVGGNAEC